MTNLSDLRRSRLHEAKDSPIATLRGSNSGARFTRQLVRLRFPSWASPAFIVGGLVVLFWLFAMVFPQALSAYDPLLIVGRRLQAPSALHYLGTDALGRDVFSRTMYGAQHSLPIALIVVISAVVIGAAAGSIAGYKGGLVGAAIMRLVDITLSFPPILLAMAVAASLGPGLGNAAIAMVVVWWPVYARLVRAQVLEVREREHVEAAVAAGASHFRILTKHILPLCWMPVLISATMDLGQVMLLAASLSFIGLGAMPPTPEWGAMITDGATYFYDWWIAFGPGMAILTAVLGFNFIGDGLRDYLDPRSSK